MTTPHEFQDALLARRLKATLDQQAEAQFGDSTDAFMDQVRAEAQRRQYRTRQRHWFTGLAVAASTAFFLALPISGLMPTSSLHVESQMLDEMDWLLAMEEAARDA